MSASGLAAFLVPSLIVLGLVLYRLLWAASSLASSAAMGRLPGILPVRLRR